MVPAILYEEEIKKQYMKAICDDHFKFYMASSYREFDLNIEKNDWGVIQKASIDKEGNIVGYMRASIDRDSKVVNCFGILNFTKKISMTFAVDLIHFLRELRDKNGASKFEFVAYVGGSNEN